jgi:hypothetical protein
MLDSVLRPIDSDDSIHHQETSSNKKMTKGESLWDTVKVIMVCIINTLHNTIYLPAHRLARIWEILASISATQRCVSPKKWQQLLDELRYMALYIPTDIGIFSILQEALKTSD